MKPPDAFTLEKVRQWLAHADEDLRVARHGFSMPGTPSYRVIAFHAQQCAEKYLKASLVFQGASSADLFLKVRGSSCRPCPSAADPETRSAC
jgi:hypothetical protein